MASSRSFGLRKFYSGAACRAMESSLPDAAPASGARPAFCLPNVPSLILATVAEYPADSRRQDRSPTMERTKLGTLKEAWSIARPYWFCEERWVARGLLAAVVALNLLQVWIMVRLNSWRNDFYNTLQNYDQAAFFSLLGLFAVL